MVSNDFESGIVYKAEVAEARAPKTGLLAAASDRNLAMAMEHFRQTHPLGGVDEQKKRSDYVAAAEVKLEADHAARTAEIQQAKQAIHNWQGENQEFFHRLENDTLFRNPAYFERDWEDFGQAAYSAQQTLHDNPAILESEEASRQVETPLVKAAVRAEIADPGRTVEMRDKHLTITSLGNGGFSICDNNNCTPIERASLVSMLKQDTVYNTLTALHPEYEGVSKDKVVDSFLDNPERFKEVQSLIGKSTDFAEMLKNGDIEKAALYQVAAEKTKELSEEIGKEIEAKQKSAETKIKTAEGLEKMADVAKAIPIVNTVAGPAIQAAATWQKKSAEEDQQQATELEERRKEDCKECYQNVVRNSETGEIEHKQHQHHENEKTKTAKPAKEVSAAEYKAEHGEDKKQQPASGQTETAKAEAAKVVKDLQSKGTELKHDDSGKPDCGCSHKATAQVSKDQSASLG